MLPTGPRRPRDGSRPLRASSRFRKPLAMNVLHALQQKLHAALAGLVDDPTPYAALVKPAQDARFGDYQANCAMPLAKVLRQKPAEVAQRVAERLDLGDMLEPPTVAGPGFINLRLRA